MAEQQEYYIGLDIGGTKCAVTLGKFTGPEETEPEIADKVKFPTNPEEAVKGKRAPAEVLEEFAERTKRLLAKNHGKPKRIGISCGGPLDSQRGVILSPPNLPGWDNVEAVKYFTGIFGVECVLQNDANACAVAEWMFGAGKGTRNMIFLTFGTGLGAGLILDGKLYAGTSDMAGEIGHVRCEADGPVGYGKAGSFEGFCSGGGIAQLGKMLGLPDGMTAKEIADGAYAGEERCIEAYKISGQKLGKMLSILIDLLNPEAVVIGGVFARSSDLLLPYAEEVIRQESLSYSSAVCRILPVGLGEFVGDYSALALARFA
ncbi:MAG: ROK family protein [Clostridia bacterium]